MKQNNRWRFVLVVAIVAWSLYEIYPPTARDLVQQFAERAENTDAAFTNILEQVATLDAARPDREFANLQDAIGTNDIQKYFRNAIVADNELYPTTFILNQIQRDASGKIKLGLDLQGGTSPARIISAVRPMSAARCRRRSRCCASAWTPSAWPNRSFSRRAATGF